MERIETKSIFSLRLLAYINAILIILALVLSVKQILIPRFFHKLDAEFFSSEAARIFSLCKNTDTEKCYKKEFTTLTTNNNFHAGEQTLYALQDLDSTLRHCHVLSHEVGKAAVRANPAKWEEVVNESNPNTCGGGFFHGALEAHAGDDPNFVINKESIDALCVQGGPLDFKARTCTHLMGHLLLIETVGDIEPALPVCQDLAAALSQECYTGIFMEDSYHFSLADHGLASVPAHDAAFIEKQKLRCLRFNGIAARACWMDMAELYIEDSGYDIIKTYNLCQAPPEAEAKKECHFKAAVLAVISPDYDDPNKLKNACGMLKTQDDRFEQCSSIIVSSLLYYTPKFTGRANTICSQMEKTDMRGRCYSQLGRELALSTKTPALREPYCQIVPAEYREMCVGKN